MLSLLAACELDLAIASLPIREERFILMKEGHCLGDQVLSFCTRRDFHPNVLCRSAQIETIRALVQAGMGISLIPAMACQAARPPQPHYRSLTPPLPRRSVVAVWLRDRPPGRAAGAFLQHLRETAAHRSDNRWMALSLAASITLPSSGAWGCPRADQLRRGN